MIPNIKEHIDGLVCSEDALGVGSVIAGELKIPMAYIRNKKKKWGLKNKIEGDMDKVLKGKNVMYLGLYKEEAK